MDLARSRIPLGQTDRPLFHPGLVDQAQPSSRTRSRNSSKVCSRFTSTCVGRACLTAFAPPSQMRRKLSSITWVSSRRAAGRNATGCWCRQGSLACPFSASENCLVVAGKENAVPKSLGRLQPVSSDCSAFSSGSFSSTSETRRP